MKISFGQCEDILKTLPVGYYLGHPVALRLDPTGDATYIEMEMERITISYQNIATALENAPDDIDRESVIRGLLYHEVSHALLTPDFWAVLDSKLGKYNSESDSAMHYNTRFFNFHCKFNKIPNNKLRYIYDHLHDIINIAEDERIETICRDYYMNVDFKRNVLLLNGVDPKVLANDSEPIRQYYAAVRFATGKKSLVTEARKYLSEPVYMDIIGKSASEKTVWLLISNLVRSFAKFIPDDFGQNAQENQSVQSAQDPSASQPNSQNQESGQNAQNSQSVQAAQDNSKNGKIDIDALLKNIEKQVAEKSPFSNMILKNMFETLSTNREASQSAAKLDKILKSALNKNKNRSSGSYGYAGRIDPRATRNNDYRWFVKKSQGSDVKRYDKAHFNLFCDNSGSFMGSRNTMNGLILAVKKLAQINPDFTVDVIHCANGVTEPDQDSPYLNCQGGSRLTNNVFDIYRRHQKPNATNVNITVFDGDMHDELNDVDGKNFAVFDHPNCIVVSDDDNEPYFKNYAPQAKCTFITAGYAKLFENAVMTQIEKMLG